MHSKWFPWDFFKNNPKVIDTDLKGIHAISVFDSFLESLLSHKLKRSEEFKVVVGSEFDQSWLDSNLATMDLFSMGSSDNYRLVRPEDADKKTLEAIAKGEVTIDDRLFVMIFTSDNKLFDKMVKADHIHTTKVEAPRFWEQGKYLTFLAREMGVPLGNDVHAYLLSAIPNTTGEFVHALRTIRLHSENPSSPMRLDQVKELVAETRIDQFALASLFGKRDKKSFFKSLIEIELDFDALRTLFGFMQGHLSKIMDPTYIQRKSRPSKYDREIEMHSPLWRKSELTEEIHLFSTLELMAKEKNVLLKNRIREIYLSQY